MAFLTFSSDVMTNCQPTVAMVLGYFRREYNARIKIQKVRKADECTYLIDSPELPETPITVSCVELVPGVVQIKITHARRF